MNLREKIFQERNQPKPAPIAGWREWLADHFQHVFTAPLAPFHEEFWEWTWNSLNAKLNGKPLPGGTSFFAVWSRGFGKSTMCEIAPILAAALEGEGLALYVSGTQTLAEMHLSNIEELLSSPEIAERFPELATPKRSRVTKMTMGWRRSVLRLANGFTLAAVGLDSSMRGLRYGKQRPGMIILDDVDDANDSLTTAQKKLSTLTRKVLPSGAKDTLVLCAQNLIWRGSVINQIITGKAPALSNRTVSGPYPAIENMRTEYRNGRTVITGGTPTWAHLGLEECQQFVDNSGLPAFLSEYQHELKAVDEGLVFPEYTEAVHIISWEAFHAVYGASRHGGLLPPRFNVAVGYDHGATGPDKHPAVAIITATSPEDSVLPGKVFVVAEIVAEAHELPDDMAGKIMATLAALGKHPEAYPSGAKMWRGVTFIMSPEAASVRDIFRKKHGLPFVAGKPGISTGKAGGIAQTHHYLQVDHSVRHPFKPKVNGAAKMYFVVDDAQLERQVDSYGLKRTREEIQEWRYRQVEMTDSGLQEERPVKFFDDAMDALRMVMGLYGPSSAPLVTDAAYERLRDGMRAFRVGAMADGFEFPERKPKETWRDETDETLRAFFEDIESLH